MKKNTSVTLLFIVMIMVGMLSVNAMAIGKKEFSSVVVCTTYPVTALNGLSVDISSITYGTLKITRITISNSDILNVPQQVDFYDNLTTTNTITLIWSVTIPSGTTVNTPVQEWFSDRHPLEATGLRVRKSATGSAVRVSVKWH